MSYPWMRLSAIALACAALTVSPAQVSAMGLMQVYDAALQNDPSYRSAISENQAGQEYKVIGRSSLLPTLQYSYATSQNKGDKTEPFMGKEVSSNVDYRSITNNVTLRQTLFNIDAHARYDQGILQTRYSDAQFEGRRQDLVIRLVQAYVEVKYADDQLKLYTAQRDSLLEQKRVNDRMFEKGEGTRTDMLETQAKLDVSEASVIEATDNLSNARVALAGMIGRDVTELDGLVANFNPQLLSTGDFEEWKLIALKNNAELAAGRFNVEISEQEIIKAKAGHAPRLDLNASYNHGISDSLTTQKQDSKIHSVGIQFVLPLYSGGYVSAVSKQAVANRERAKSDLDATMNKVMLELRKQFSTVISSIAKMEALQKSVTSANLLVEATKLSVKGGVRINLDVLNAQQQLVLSKRDLALARYTYLTSFLKLRMAAGILNMDDLQAVAGYFSAAN